MNETNGSKIVYAQTVLFQKDVLSLKEKTGAKSVKDALAKAVEHLLKCTHCGKCGKKKAAEK